MNNTSKTQAKKIRKKKRPLNHTKRLRLLLKRLKRISKNQTSPIQRFSFEYVLQNMSTLLNNKKPFKIFDIPDIFSQNTHIEEEIAKLLEECHPEPLDISVSMNKEFSGHYSEHKTISLNFKEFLDYSGPYNLYLAQIPLYEKRPEEQNILNPESNKDQEFKVRGDNQNNLKIVIDRSQALGSFSSALKHDIDRLNLWFSKKETFSSLHYDSYDNFLFMLTGRKTFNIYPPNAKEVVCESVLTSSFHQAKSPKQSKHKIKVEISSNEAIFIPQGWFHEVVSKGSCIVAVNFWFNSIEQICNGREKYLFRYLMANQIEKEIANALEEYKGLITKIFKETELFKTFRPLDYNQKAQFIIENENQRLAIQLFTFTALQIPEKSLRSFIIQIMYYNSAKAQYILCNLDDRAAEYLTNKFEKVDKEPRSDNEQECYNTSTFYNLLEETIDYQAVTESFLISKRRLRENLLKNVLFEKLSSSFEF